MTTVLVTGAAGFIGSHAAESFLRRGFRVVGIDSFHAYYPRFIKERNVAAIRAVGEMPLYEIDITDEAEVKKVFDREKPTAVLHLAALAGVRPSILRPADYQNVNVVGTTHLLEAAVQTGVKRFLLASSSSVYGNNAVPFSESQNVDAPISPYAASKKATELIAHTYWHLHKLPVFCLRFFTVFGPRQRPDLAIHKFVKLALEGKPIPIFGDGSTSRDYTYVSDIVDGINAALDRCDRYGIYNLGGSHPITLKQLIEAVESAVGRKIDLDRRPAQPGDVERTYADLTRSTAELGYKPKVSIEEGLKRFVEWYRTTEV